MKLIIQKTTRTHIDRKSISGKVNEGDEIKRTFHLFKKKVIGGDEKNKPIKT